ncbi:hypothetical protein ACOMHN_017896 [Nucella lapillus]
MWIRQSHRQGQDKTDDVQQQADPPSTTTDDTALLFPPSPKPSKTSPAKYQTFPVSGVILDPEGDEAVTTTGQPPTPRESSPGGKATVVSQPHPTRRGNTIFIYLLSCFAAIGGLLFGYDTGIISGSMLLIQPYFQLSTFWEEVIVSGTIGAAALSALAGGAICDRVGRRTVIMGASVIFTVGAVVMGAAPDKETLLVGRIVVGVGIGFSSMAVPVYIAELSPTHIRGLLVTLIQLFITIGILLSSIVAGAFSEVKDTGWR